MDIESYIASLRRRVSQLEINKAAITQRGMRMGSRWGLRPFVDTTASWLAELERRIRELTTIADALERS